MTEAIQSITHFYVIFIGESDGLYLKNGRVFRRTDIPKPPECQCHVQYEIFASLGESVTFLHVKKSDFDAFGALAMSNCLAGIAKSCYENLPDELKINSTVASILNNALIQTLNFQRDERQSNVRQTSQ